MQPHPNVLLIVVDQMRRDALGINPGLPAHTPHLDRLAREGVNFCRAYSACPSCIAARAGLLTGLLPEHHGFTGYDPKPEWHYPVTLPGVFADAGYHTQCVGKMHVEPPRNLVGFHNVVLHDGYLHDKRANYRDPMQYDDYLPDVRRFAGSDFDINECGMGCNGYAARVWKADERFHPTAWVTQKSIEFLRRRDTTKPFFLKVSYHRPHSPLDPPEAFRQMYDDVELPPPASADWDGMLGCYCNAENPVPGDGASRERARRAYLALVSQIDYELNRLLMELGDLRLMEETVIVFCSDHGDMLFDHGVVRKSLPFEGSCAIPFFLRLPGAARGAHWSGRTDRRTVELCDLFPTLCAACGIPIPAGLDGVNLLDETARREYLHGEHANGPWSNHYLTDGREKYCWFSQSGREMLFDIDADPQELHDLAAVRPGRIVYWREKLVHALASRPGAVRDGAPATGYEQTASLPWAGISQAHSESRNCATPTPR